ncbi:MAG: class I SAM-dependent methyltransferase [Gammaproteobacteria bacterium]
MNTQNTQGGLAVLDFPEPSLEELKISKNLEAFILETIEKKPSKSINFSEYMAHVLYHPNYGFYIREHAIFGEKGHFTTAPESGPLLAEAILNTCLNQEKLEPNIIEWGAGRGSMALQILNYYDLRNLKLDQYIIIEISPALRKIQKSRIQEAFPEFLDKCTWFGSPEAFLEQYPAGLNALCIANEVLDALPCERFLYTDKNFYKLAVGSKKNRNKNINSNLNLDFLLEPLEEFTIEKLKDFNFPEAYFSEINLNLNSWFRSVNRMLKKGEILILDYGYLEPELYHPSRKRGTFLCYYKNRAHAQALLWPGLQDMTAHVNFSESLRLGEALGWKLEYYGSQGEFILESGLDFNNLDTSDLNALKLLCFPSEQGHGIKVLKFSKN